MTQSKSNTHGYDYDYFVIGAGSGGVRSARIAASHGAKVGIAEGRFFGGTCVNIGCVPKKLFTYGADFRSSFEDARGYGWDAQIPNFDWSTLIQNKDAEILRLNGIYEKLLDNAGVTAYKDYAKFVDPHTLHVGGQNITADKILIATGGQPRKLGIKGGEHAIISDDAFALKELPSSIIIYGGGYIAVEFAHIFNGLGIDTHLVYRGDLFLRGFDDDIRKALADEMTKKGVKLIFNTDVHEISKDATQANQFNVTLHDKKSGARQVTTGLVMAAIGRTPNINGLDLGKASVAFDSKSGAVQINKDYQTSQDHIYAVGDVTDKVQLTPIAIAEGHLLADRLFGGLKRDDLSYQNIPTAVFSDPSIGTVGLTEAQALENGYSIDVYLTSFKPMKYTLTGRDERTTMKLIVDQKTDRVLGLHILGLDAAEMTQGFGVAMVAGAKKSDFDRTIGIHPTSAEEFVTMRKPSYSKP